MWKPFLHCKLHHGSLPRPGQSTSHTCQHVNLVSLKRLGLGWSRNMHLINVSFLVPWRLHCSAPSCSNAAPDPNTDGNLLGCCNSCNWLRTAWSIICRHISPQVTYLTSGNLNLEPSRHRQRLTSVPIRDWRLKIKKQLVSYIIS